MKKEKIVLLGASGSIGKQTLDLLKDSPNFSLVAITLHSRYKEIEPYLEFFPDLQLIGIIDNDVGVEFKKKYEAKYNLAYGNKANEIVLNISSYDSVVNAIMGNDGLEPTLTCLAKNKTLYLANKESIIEGKPLIDKILKEHPRSRIYPIDSEHVGLNKLINMFGKENIEKYYITASGGALRDFPLSKFPEVTKEQVLNHPTWNMGSKITIDSATMVNKAYEIIEASALFDIPLDKIEPLICYQSTLHAGVNLKDTDINSIIFDYGINDMHESIKFALSHGTIKSDTINSSDEDKMSSFTFKNEIEYFRYPLFHFILNEFKEKSYSILSVINTADEIAINSFLNDKIKYVDIETVITETCSHFNKREINSIEDIKTLIEETKLVTSDIIDSIGKRR